MPWKVTTTDTWAEIKVPYAKTQNNAHTLNPASSQRLAAGEECWGEMFATD